MDRIKHLSAISLLGKLLNNKTFGVIISDGEGNVVYANDNFQALCGYCGEELAGANVSKLFFPCDDLIGVESIKNAYGDQEAESDLEKFIVKKDGSRSWIRYSGIIYDDAARNFSVIGIVRNIDDIKNIEKNFYESQERTKQMLKLIPCGIFAIDNNGKITIFNKMAEEITGYKNKDVVGRGREIFSVSSCD
ncbi:MAG TPA: PAS domain-containing protein, partial [Candidatus Wallbacteria bacterium]|nr:PAS domain-containing protein [Candidatus Wallbacteria bacterium]